MRGCRFVSGRVLGGTLVLLLVVGIGAGDVKAQGFGWFGAPQPYRSYRPRRRSPPPPAPQPLPVPVPRPHLPSDPPVPPPDAVKPAPEPAPSSRPTPQSEPPRGGEKAPSASPPPSKAEDKAPAATLPIPIPKPPVQDHPVPAHPAPAAGAVPPSSPSRAPNVAPSGARLGEAPGQPDEDATCLGRLASRKVEVEPTQIGSQPDPRCTVVQPVRLKGLTLPGGEKIEFPERPTIACTLADSFSSFVRDLMAPLAKGTYGATVAAVWTGPGLECRSRDHVQGAKLSAHGLGLAIDVAQVKLADGRMIEVGSSRGDLDQGFETATRAGGCGYFHTVLGPGSDSYHRNHWHFDLEVRGAKGDSKFCK